MLKHLLSACKIYQCDNTLVMQVILRWFETDRISYSLYLFSLQSLPHRGWPCETSAKAIHVLHLCDV